MRSVFVVKRLEKPNTLHDGVVAPTSTDGLASSNVSLTIKVQLHYSVLVRYLFSLPGYEVPNGLAEERRQKGVEWRGLLQEGIQSFEQRLLVTQLIVDHSHIARQKFTRNVWKPGKRDLFDPRY